MFKIKARFPFKILFLSQTPVTNIFERIASKHASQTTSKLILTVDEANEDTISAFEETDAAVDLRIKNSVCLVIDLEGFFVQKKFQVREMGYYSWDEHFDCHAFFQPAALKNLSHRDKKTVNFAKHNIH